MPRGQKTCPGCGETTGPRTKICPKCKYDYFPDSNDSGGNAFETNSISSSLYEEEYLKTRVNKCPNCGEDFESGQIKDCYNNIVYHNKYNVYCSRICMIESDLQKNAIIIKFINGSSLDEDELKLVESIKNRKIEIEEETKNLENYPEIKFITKPRAKKNIPTITSTEELQRYGIKVPPLRTENTGVEETEEESEYTLSDFISEYKEEPEEENKEVEKPKSSLLSFLSGNNTVPLVSSNSSTVEIENEEGCLAELIKFKEKIDFVGIGEINNLIPQCSRDVLKSTIKLLLDGGGYKGYMMETKGQRRGKKYKLIERE